MVHWTKVSTFGTFRFQMHRETKCTKISMYHKTKCTYCYVTLLVRLDFKCTEKPNVLKFQMYHKTKCAHCQVTILVRLDSKCTKRPNEQKIINVPQNQMSLLDNPFWYIYIPNVPRNTKNQIHYKTKCVHIIGN